MVTLVLSVPPKTTGSKAGTTTCASLSQTWSTATNALPVGREALTRLGGKAKTAGEGKGLSDTAFLEEQIVIPVGITPATLKKYTLYEILGFAGEIGASADTEVLKKAYHKAVLMYHPDKAQFKTQDGKEDRCVFLKIQEAFNVLTSDTKRRAYDSQLPFDESIPTEEMCAKYLVKGPQRFFKLFDPIFKRNARFAVKKPVPDLGDVDSPLPVVRKFYEYWNKFDSWRDFTGKDAEYKPDDASCREEKRYMQKENEKKAKELKKKEMERIIRLVTLAEKYDPRIVADKEQKQAQKNAAQADKAAKAKRLEDATNLSKAWSQRLEDEAQAKKGATKEDREKLKKAQSKARNTFRKLLRATATLSLGDVPKAGGEYGYLADKDVELICANADVSDINDMNDAMGGDKAAKDSADFQLAGLSVVKDKLARVNEVAAYATEDKRMHDEGKKRELDERNARSLPKRDWAHAADRAWTEDHLGLLAQALLRYPAGTAKQFRDGDPAVSRWVMVAFFLNDKIKDTLAVTPSFTADECLVRAFLENEARDLLPPAP